MRTFPDGTPWLFGRGCEALIPKDGQPPIRREAVIARHYGDPFGKSLRDQEAVDRIFMISIHRQSGQLFQMPDPDGKEYGAHRVNRLLGLQGGYSQPRLHHNFPDGYDAQVYFRIRLL